MLHKAERAQQKSSVCWDASELNAPPLNGEEATSALVLLESRVADFLLPISTTMFRLLWFHNFLNIQDVRDRDVQV